MSAEGSERIDVSALVQVLQEEALLREHFGDPGDWPRVLGQLEVLLERARHDEQGTARRDVLAPAWRAEFAACIEELHESLSAGMMAEVKEGLSPRQEEDGVFPDLWADLHTKDHEEMRQRLRVREVSAQAGFRMALRRYARKPTYRGFVQTVRSLVDLYETRRRLDPVFSIDHLQDERQRMVRVLRGKLPRIARAFIAARIEERFRSHRGSSRSDETEDGSLPWLRELTGAGLWRPELVTADHAAETDAARVLFTDEAQARYEQLVADEIARERRRQHEQEVEERERLTVAAERERRQQEEDERVRIAALVERERHERVEAARRVEDARLWQASMECRRTDLALRLLNARRREREQFERWLAEQDRLRQEEAERQRERHRLAQEQLQRQVEEEQGRRRNEKRLRRERMRIRVEHRLRLPAVVSRANRDRVRGFLKERGIDPADLTPQMRAAFRTEFRLES
jgi:hypothetical protein